MDGLRKLKHRTIKPLPGTAVVPTSVVAQGQGADAATSQGGPLPSARVGSSVGGKALHGPVELVRVAGSDVDVMLPAGTTFAAWKDAALRCGAFADQASHLESLPPGEPGPALDQRPLVGIILSEPRMLVPGGHKNTQNLIALVKAMGCRPVLIPPCADLAVSGGPDARTRAIAALASQLDGLVGPGGADVDPSIYGEPLTHALHTNVTRDRFEADFVKVALDCNLFAFGICRSHQLWNAATGGRLVQDVQQDGLVSVSHKEGSHALRVERRSMIYEAVRQEALRVNSYHHQAVDLTGWGFRAVGRVKDDATGKDMIEATERWNGVTTQYHPELMQDDALQRALFSVLGRRAHVFALIRRQRPTGLPELLATMRADPRFDATDIAWAKRELGRRLR